MTEKNRAGGDDKGGEKGEAEELRGWCKEGSRGGIRKREKRRESE